ncbi:Band 7 protein OS=Tsukamurella paurometabola (strain ATCC 8368 / DSM / CCUG 35730 / CIP 100753/ JCM 10117 / KCTC 9821 / NBRC 16120 / NCIMB 702349 / NCTC 13040) OX=521096 GN=Tpau_3863 PE=4 SV=1 [Tsukamurella paurometabola]|uniref:Band 7 protein n=1 Tax=Tsukamurella paurometabola (strain ATCC 8368 / DSM 20162 / CCUG 35730 / CIP 100753 / JCM 10117 / KCTC 9821 / NBRC 16120 / NCIMB 702349 / NCTC 13040) TaxID=521096 RepID=D5UMG4_TSUPD|nr:SPFH domain-containing protein [Tsukamurella paurometabola]ADG80438.1 band 7 protein [Tsukamurella paurometabola DSM 20162]SUP39640.1 SPFH domain / Band 7 family [Tsukamurella paurometabola]
MTDIVQPEDTQVAISERPAWHAGAGAAVAAFLAIIALLAGAAGLVLLAINQSSPGYVVGTVILVIAAALLASMIMMVSPGHTLVVQLFGKYVGTVRPAGLGLVLPLTSRRQVSVRVHNFETAELKVNDSTGNPVNIAAIIVWQVADTARATFAVEDYEEFIISQAESALRHVTTSHPYDADDAVAGATSLRGSTDQVAGELAEQVAARVELAGLEILEARISSLAYAPEIAQAMLQRQQASALLAAREKIVEGAVGLVENALTRLEDNGIVELDDERRAAMVSNLLVVLCSDSRTTPVVNTGSLYS